MVTPDMWDELQNGSSTNEFVTQALNGWPWLTTSFGQLPRTRSETFEMGFEEYL
jgi:hypothetical protein